MRALLYSLGLFGVVLTAPWCHAQEFYAGKTIRIVVGFPAGGGFDTYSRVLGRHITKYIPGNPTVVVDNVTGAGSLIAANSVYKTAKPDGLTIGNFIGNLISQQLFGGSGIEFDARKFEWIGVPVKDHVVCALTKASGIPSVDVWMAAKTRPGELRTYPITTDRSSAIRFGFVEMLRLNNGTSC